jgi:hypothetical protein
LVVLTLVTGLDLGAVATATVVAVVPEAVVGGGVLTRTNASSAEAVTEAVTAVRTSSGIGILDPWGNCCLSSSKRS